MMAFIKGGKGGKVGKDGIVLQGSIKSVGTRINASSDVVTVVQLEIPVTERAGIKELQSLFKVPLMVSLIPKQASFDFKKKKEKEPGDKPAKDKK